MVKFNDFFAVFSDRRDFLSGVRTLDMHILDLGIGETNFQVSH
jgi:hypothetical protein